MLRVFIQKYTRPEMQGAAYINNGKIVEITRRSGLTNLLSDICYDIYGLTPIINNEVINKTELTTVTQHSRNKLVAGLLRTDLEKNLGLTGTGQEISIMRSTLINTGILVQNNSIVRLNLKPNDVLLSGLLTQIEEFIIKSSTNSGITFDVLYKRITGAEGHIGIRRGLVPIFLSAVLHEYKTKVVISDRFGQVMINSDTIEQINADPSLFSISYIDWNPDKERYLMDLGSTFGDYISDDGNSSMYERVALGMRRWYLGLPKYAKSIKKTNSNKFNSHDIELIKEMRKNTGSYDLIFSMLPRIFGTSQPDEKLAERIKVTKEKFDSELNCLEKQLTEIMRDIFCIRDRADCEKMSLTSIIRDWCDKIDAKAFNQLFPDGTDRCLSLFKNVTNDEPLFVSQAAKMATDLRIEDWDEDVIIQFRTNMEQYRETAEAFNSGDATAISNGNTKDYELKYRDESGVSVVKRFAKVDESKKGKLLYNAVCSQLESMGQSITEQEKRQVLMEILKEMC